MSYVEALGPQLKEETGKFLALNSHVREKMLRINTLHFHFKKPDEGRTESSKPSLRKGGGKEEEKL